ncbi:hypothetical protein LJK88_07700 [Paenibacillus sp. P26]|nr:hypothetical protein LJK88_07700 [Paenibacillus sp. P26]
MSDWDMIMGRRRLVRQESILAGPSSGGVVMALKRMEPRLPEGSVCAVILHDRGERYLDTVYSDEWVAGQFGRSIEDMEE